MSYTLQELANKIDYEGGVGEALYYFGRELPVDNPELQMKWRVAYDALAAVSAMIPEPAWEEE